MSTQFSFLEGMASSDTLIPCLPFSPIFDMLNANNTIGPDGVTYTNGGISRQTTIVGGNNTQKTGMTVLAMMRVLIRIAGSVVFFFDIEGNFDVDRLEEAFDREIGIPGYFREKIMNKRFFYFSRNDVTNPCDGSFVINKFKDIANWIKKEIENKKDIYTTTPYPDNNGKPMKIITPILTIVDSISEMHFQNISKHFQEGEVDAGGEKRTRDLSIGNMRRIVHEDADVLGGVSGVYQIWVAQVVEKLNMTGRPEEKESVFIRPGRKLKAPRTFLRLPQIGHEIIKGTVLKQDQEWMYPNPFGKDVDVTKDAKETPDLMIYQNQPYRNKAGMSGVNSFFIGSQSLGIQEGLTMYHVLKTNDYFGMDGSKVSHWNILYPEAKLGRTTSWAKLLEDQKLLRATTIMYHLWQQNHFQLAMPAKYRLTPQELMDKIKAQGIDWDDILENTVDYWFTNPDIKKFTVSIGELVRIAVGERKPYWIKSAAKEVKVA